MTSYSKITIAGSEVFPDSINVSKILGDINASSKFTARLYNDNGEFSKTFNIGDEVKIYTDKDTNPPTTQIFQGIVENVLFKGKENKENIALSGRDYSLKLMDRTVEPEVYTNLPAGSIVKDIITKYTDDITTTNVLDGQVVDKMVFNQIPVFDAIKELANFTGFMFYVDESKDLNFKEKATTSSGYTFGSGGLPIISTDYKVRRDSIFNDVWVYGDRYLDGFQETFTGDGAGSIFTLGYKPSNTTITVDGTLTQPGGIYQMLATAGSDVKYLVNYDDQQVIFTSGTDQGDNVPGAGSSVVIDYMRDLPVVKHGDNDASVSQYGRRTKVIQDATIKDPQAAATIMLSELDEYSDPLKQGTLNLYNIGNVNVGDTCIVNIPTYDINELSYNILEANYDLTKSKLLGDNILTIKVNKKVDDITDTLKDVILQQKKLQGKDIQTTDLLTRYKISAGSVGIRSSGAQIWTRGIGSSFILGHPINGLLGSYSTHALGDYRTGSTLQWSGAYPASTDPIGIQKTISGAGTTFNRGIFGGY